MIASTGLLCGRHGETRLYPRGVADLRQVLDLGCARVECEDLTLVDSVRDTVRASCYCMIRLREVRVLAFGVGEHRPVRYQ
jgi:hypothetical protein